MKREFCTPFIKQKIIVRTIAENFRAEFKFLDKHYSSDDVAVNSSGWISKFVRGKIDVACRCDVCEYSLLIKDWRLSVNFPFDTQYCNIDLDIGIATSQWAILHEANISSWVIVSIIVFWQGD